MKHCWHPTGESVSNMVYGGDLMVCCWCGTNGVQKFETERALTSGHGSHYLKLVKVRLPVQGASEVCTAQRENQKHGAPHVATGETRPTSGLSGKEGAHD